MSGEFSIPLFIGIPGLLGSYAIACLALALIFQRSRFPFQTASANLICALPLGPIAIAWLLWVMLRFFPGHTHFVYVLCSLAPFLLILLLNLKLLKIFAGEIKSDLALVRKLNFKNQHQQFDWPFALLALGTIGLFILNCVQLFGMPMMASDPLEYATLAEVIYSDRSLENYPLDPSNSQGFYARSAHPPAFHMLITYSYIWQGGIDSSRFLRFIQLHYFISIAGLLALICSKLGSSQDARKMAGLGSVFLLLSVPFYISLVEAFHVDPIRIPLFLLGIVFVFALLNWENNLETTLSKPKGLKYSDKRYFQPPILLTGLAVGLGMFAHSIGILLLPFAHGTYFLLTRSSFVRRCVICTVFGLIALFFGAGQYVQNIIDYGVPLHDTEPIWELSQVDHKTDVRYRRNLVTDEQRIKNGLLVWFFNPTLYGYVHQLALVSLILFWRKIWSNLVTRVMLLVLIQFYSLVLLTMSLGVDLIIKNIRYMLTIAPFLIVIAALAGGEIYDRIIKITKPRV